MGQTGRAWQISKMALLTPFRTSRFGKRGDAGQLLFLLNTIQIIDDSEDPCSHDDFHTLLRPSHLPIKRIDIMRQVDNGVESFSPNWHFTSAVSGNCSQSIYGFIDSVRGKDAVVVLGQYRQIARRYL